MGQESAQKLKDYISRLMQGFEKYSNRQRHSSEETPISTRKEFEKLFMYFEDDRYQVADVAIANCPNDWSKCSFVLSTWSDNHHGVAHVFINEPELETIIEALQKVKTDMQSL